MVPVVDVPPLGASVGPVGVVADARHADEQVDVAEDLAEHQRRDTVKRDGFGVRPPPTARVPSASRMRMELGRADLVEPHLIGVQVEIRAGIGGVTAVIVADPLDPELRAQPPFGQIAA